MSGARRGGAQVVGPQQEIETTEDESSDDGSEWRAPWGPIMVVLCIEVCERLAYYTVAGSQRTYMNKQLGMSPSSAASMNSVFSMLCFLWCLPGGLLADAVGRYNVIIGFASIYAVGVVLTTIAVHANFQVSLKPLFMLGTMVLIPMGTGGIKPNISNFGADQIGDETEVQRTTQKQFFSFFYMAINVGALFAFGYVVNVTTHGEPMLGIDMSEGYFAAYSVTAVMMVIVVLTFVCSTRFFALFPGGGTDGFTTMVRAVTYSARHGGGWRAVACVVGWMLLPLFVALTVASVVIPGPDASAVVEGNATSPAATRLLSEAYVYPNEAERACGPPPTAGDRPRRLEGWPDWESAEEAWQREASAAPAARNRRLFSLAGHSRWSGQDWLTNVALFLGLVSCGCLVVAHSNNRWMMLPKSIDGGFSLEEVRAGFATVPIIIVVNVSFSMAYNATNNAWPSQGCQMNTMVGGSQLNGAFFNVADMLSIVIFTPLLESFIFPGIARLKGSQVRLGQKLIAGLLIAAASNLVSAYLEVERRHSRLMCEVGFSECAPNGIHMRDMSAFLMFIPFTLIGIAEIFVNSCMYYFAYTAAPPKVRSFIQALNLFFSGSVSNAFTAAVMKSTFPNDMDSGNMEIYYYVNCICALVGVIMYFVLTRCGRNAEDIEKKVRDEELDATEHQYNDTGVEL